VKEVEKKKNAGKLPAFLVFHSLIKQFRCNDFFMIFKLL